MIGPLKKRSNVFAMMQSWSYLGRMSDTTSEDIPYLVWRKSGYDELPKSHHSRFVHVVAIQVERHTKKFSSEKRRAAILKTFCHLTGYSSYGDAYKNEKGDRESTQKGVLVLNSTLMTTDEDEVPYSANMLEC
jgi:hypothetical protein